jgi:hypothetical protein
MTTVTELITYLQTLPPEATVDVLSEDSSGYSSYCSWVDLELPSGSCFTYEGTDSMEFYSGTGKILPFLRLGGQ